MVVFEDALLSNNPILVRSICLMWNYNILDLVFIPYEDQIIIKIKTFNNFNLENTDLSHSLGFYNSISNNLNKNKYEQLVLNLKLACNLNIIDNSKPQTGSFAINIDNSNFAIRASFHPTNHNQSLCLRLIKESVFNNIAEISNELTKGLNIIGGKTCSGKTTLMYSSIMKFKGHVITLEDPVEILLKNVSQTDVSLIGYEEGIKSALRQSPDLICIGEIRDELSAKAAIKAALTGHIVLATIHISSPESVFFRLEDLGASFARDVISNIFFMENFNYKTYKFQ